MQANPQNNVNGLSVLYGLLQAWVYRLGRPVRDALLYSSAYLAFIAAGEVLIVTELLSLPLSPAPLVAALLTFAVYGNDRLADVEADEKTSPARAAFVRRNQDLLYSLSAVAYGLGVALAVLGGPVAFAMAFLPGVVWLCYASDLFPDGARLRPLKRVLILNSTLVAAVWAVGMTFLPIVFVGAPIPASAPIIYLFFFGTAFANVEIPNVGDRGGDREAGVETLPVVFGVDGTRKALYGLLALLAAIVGVGFGAGVLGLETTAGLSVSLLCLLTVVTCLGRIRNDILTVAAECSRLPILVIWLL
ncbi:UbiA family prenyltransferase [Halomicroarcula sp. F28]|uniref:UbiA family prenyltransferase n=1 Tax=Haloarcula salinisoli TaxID=2487746 RepID=UPI001C73D3A8|nr:UbiA family prenyltransferase [Halomicroarcula salinisoli]MBX0287816.1 UbiA family prenyltransferase [Halomicroarcula salinisoli]